MSLTADLQGLAQDTLVELFVLDVTALGGTVYRFHAGTNPLKGTVVWQGQSYGPMAIEATGFELTGNGKLPRPSLRVGNMDGLLGAVVDAYQDLLGAMVTRKRTLLKYLDAVNFAGGVNPTADPLAAFADDVYTISRKTLQTKTMIEFELGSSFDVQGVRLPGRQILQSLCVWGYKSAECGYAGPPVATIDDVPTTSASLDACGKRVASCKLRFGEFGELPFGGFPGVGLVAG